MRKCWEESSHSSEPVLDTSLEQPWYDIQHLNVDFDGGVLQFWDPIERNRVLSFMAFPVVP